MGEATRNINKSVVNELEATMAAHYAIYLLFAIHGAYPGVDLPTILLMSPYLGCVEEINNQLRILTDRTKQDSQTYSDEARDLLDTLVNKINVQSTITSAGEERDIAVLVHGRSSKGDLSDSLGFLTKRQLVTGATRGTSCVTIFGDATHLITVSEKGEFTKMGDMRRNCRVKHTHFKPVIPTDVIRSTVRDLDA